MWRWPSTTPHYLAHALTRCSSNCARPRSKEPRNVLPSMVTTSGLARRNGRGQDAHPAGKAHLKDVRVNQHEHPVEGVMGRNTIEQGEKLT